MEDLITELDPLDMPLKNGKYTWNNRRTGAGFIADRLDQFLVSVTFLIRDLIPASFALPSDVSNHKPISLVLAPSTNLGPIPFRFNALWLQEEKSMTIIRDAWRADISGSPSFVWESKLRRVRRDLKAWVKLDYTSASSKKNQLQSELSTLHSRMEREEITPYLISQEKI